MFSFPLARLFAPMLGRRPEGTFDRIGRFRAIARQRRRLLDLDERLLRDIGRSRIEAEDEARRPVWDVPAHWRSRD